MADSSKYYWLKLQKDFFKRHDIRIIEDMPNGKDYILFYLKLLVESITHEGSLRFSDAIPYNEQMLATITNTNVDIVRSAMKVFTDLGMIELLEDKTIYMAEVYKMIGSETKGAERVRKYRENQKALQCNTDVTKCNTEKEKEIDIDKEKINKKESQPDFDVEKAWNVTFDKYPKKNSAVMAKKKWMDKLIGAVDKKAVALLIVNAVVTYIDYYKKENPEDTVFKYIPKFDKWLDEDCEYWVLQYEKKKGENKC